MNIVVAACSNNGIGFNKTIPWKLKKDLLNFKKITLGGVVIMGKKTYFSLPIKPLPGRINIVLTKTNLNIKNKNIIISKDFDSALEKAKEFNKKIFIIGGESVFKESLKHPELEKIYYTDIKKEFICDVFFPKIPDNYINILEENIQEENGIKYEYKIYKKI